MCFPYLTLVLADLKGSIVVSFSNVTYKCLLLNVPCCPYLNVTYFICLLVTFKGDLLHLLQSKGSIRSPRPLLFAAACPGVQLGAHSEWVTGGATLERVACLEKHMSMFVCKKACFLLASLWDHSKGTILQPWFNLIYMFFNCKDYYSMTAEQNPSKRTRTTWPQHGRRRIVSPFPKAPHFGWIPT